MKFTKYNIFKIESGKNTLVKLDRLDIQKEFPNFNKTEIMKDEFGEYANSNVICDENFIVGNLSQSYKISLTKFDSENNTEIPIEDNVVNDNKTYFFIKGSNASIYIENRKYTPIELNPSLTVQRIEKILNTNLTKDVLDTIVIKKDSINYELSEMNNYFKNSFVSSVEFYNVPGLKLKEKTKLHNPRIDLDKALTDSWNTYSSNTVESITVKSLKGKSIAKNPFANIGLALAEQNQEKYEEIIKKIEVEEGGSKIVLKPKGNEYFNVPNYSTFKTIPEILNKIINYIKDKIDVL